jgi:hypothetical protein
MNRDRYPNRADPAPTMHREIRLGRIVLYCRTCERPTPTRDEIGRCQSCRAAGRR